MGASTGLGPHIARRLNRAGAKFVLSARNGEALNRLAEELGDSRVVVADLSRLGEAERLAREAGGGGGLSGSAEGSPAALLATAIRSRVEPPTPLVPPPHPSTPPHHPP